MHRSVPALLVAASVLGAAGAGAQREDVRCRASFAAFDRGVDAFDRKDWLGASALMIEALRNEPAGGGDGRAAGCRGQRNRYGRWLERYQPEVYLGIALNRLASCLEPGRSCARTRRWNGDWSEFIAGLPQSDRRYRELDPRALAFDGARHDECATRLATRHCPSSCATPRGSSQTYCPEAHWWQQLSAHGGLDRALAPDPAASRVAYCRQGPTPALPAERERSCAELRRLGDFFLRAIRQEESANVLVCRKVLPALDLMQEVCFPPAAVGGN